VTPFFGCTQKLKQKSEAWTAMTKFKSASFYILHGYHFFSHFCYSILTSSYFFTWRLHFLTEGVERGAEAMTRVGKPCGQFFVILRFVLQLYWFSKNPSRYPSNFFRSGHAWSYEKEIL